MMQNKHRTKNLSNHAKKLHSKGHTFPLPKHSSERSWKLLEAGDTLCVVGLSAQNRGTYSSQDCGPWTQGRYWGKKCPTLVWESFSLNRWDWHPSPIVMGPDVPAIIRICFYGAYGAGRLWVFGVGGVAPAYVCSDRPRCHCWRTK